MQKFLHFPSMPYVLDEKLSRTSPTILFKVNFGPTVQTSGLDHSLGRRVVVRQDASEREYLRAEADEKAREAETSQDALTPDRGKAERDAKVSTAVTGGAWIVNKLGESDFIQALNVDLIKLEISRDESSGPIGMFETSQGSKLRNLGQLPGRHHDG